MLTKNPGIFEAFFVADPKTQMVVLASFWPKGSWRGRAKIPFRSFGRARLKGSYVPVHHMIKGCKFFDVNTLMVDTRVILATVGATKSVALQFFGS